MWGTIASMATSRTNNGNTVIGNIVYPKNNLRGISEPTTKQKKAAVSKSIFDPGGYTGIFDKYLTPEEGSGYDIVTLPQYSFTEPRLRLTSDYLTQNIDRMNRGEMPAWYDRASQTMRAGMQRGLDESFYGRPGERNGVMQQAADMGALTGVGPKATMAQGRKLSADYMTKSKEIDEYLTSLGVDVMNQAEGRYLGASASMAQGPNSVVVNAAGGVGGAQPNQWAELGGTAMGALGQYFAGKQQQPQQQQAYPYQSPAWTQGSTFSTGYSPSGGSYAYNPNTYSGPATTGYTYQSPITNGATFSAGYTPSGGSYAYSPAYKGQY